MDVAAPRQGILVRCVSRSGERRSLQHHVNLMPTAPKSPCAHPGCPKLTELGVAFCGAHRGQRRRIYDRQRGSAAKRLYGRAWQRARAAFLNRHPLCVVCASEDRTTAATEVDHIKPHGGDLILFWDRENWQALCKSCHSSKTADERGWTGRPKGG